jgi:hypothetical protein
MLRLLDTRSMVILYKIILDHYTMNITWLLLKKIYITEHLIMSMVILYKIILDHYTMNITWLLLKKIYHRTFHHEY